MLQLYFVIRSVFELNFLLFNRFDTCIRDYQKALFHKMSDGTLKGVFAHVEFGFDFFCTAFIMVGQEAARCRKRVIYCLTISIQLKI